MSDKPIGILILAAGGSSRMGRPKQLLQLDGISLVRRSTQSAIEAGGEPIVVVTGAAAPQVAAELCDLPVHVTRNPFWEQGMGTSIRAGITRLLEIDSNLVTVLIMLCDQPGISVAVLRRLISAHRESGRPLCAASFHGTLAPPALFGRQFFDELMKIRENGGAKQILLNHSSDLLRVDCPEAAQDIDTPTDYQAVKASENSGA